MWLFSFKGRIGRRDLDLIGLWFAGMLALFRWREKSADIQNHVFCPCLLRLTAAAVMVKRLHDRGRSGAWALLMILCGCCWPETAMLPGMWQWVV